MISQFFIDRPIAANVIALVTMLLGGVALFTLPVAQYPDITPPTVQVSAVYPGANAQVVADTVAAPIEQQVNGVEGMLYMSSTSSSNGTYGLTITFEVGTNLDEAQVLVQNRVAIAEPQLPEEVRRQGVTTKKQSTDILLVATLTSPDQTFDSLYMSNYATLRLRDELSRIDGVGDVRISGSTDYGMRIWLNPNKMNVRELTVQDVVAALREQNIQVAAGQIGQPPVPAGQAFQYTVTTMGRLSEPEQFANIIIRTDADGRLTYLSDVAHVELGARSYDQFSQRSGLEAASILIYQLPGSNALDVSKQVRAKMKRLGRRFPPGMEYDIPFDTTMFVSSAINEVYRTFAEAGVLVLIVILVFLQNWRAVLIPATTVPVTIIGAFAIMPLIGFSVNMLTLFGLVLAIGIVVDDAIVIVENAAHHIEQGLSPRDATIKAMQEVTGPVMGITAVLLAVFLPTAFLGGITGQLYRQFALTIAFTALISAVNALTLKPAQCAAWLRPAPERKNILSRGFNRAYGAVERVYLWVLEGLVRFAALTLLLFAVLVGVTSWWYATLPTGFLPTEDQGYLITSIQLPDAASLQRTEQVVDELNAIYRQTPGLDNWFVLGGLSLLDGSNASSAATAFLVLDDWDERQAPGLDQAAILAHLKQEYTQIQDAEVFSFPPPAIRGLGVRGGFDMRIEDRGGAGSSHLRDAVQRVIQASQARPEIVQSKTTYRAGVPQLHADVDRVQAKMLEVSLNDVFSTLQTALGSSYVNDFNKFGRTYQVRVQADGPFRNRADDIRQLKVRNRNGEMVSLGTIVKVRESFGPQIVKRYNLYPSASITGAAAPGVSSGQALAMMEDIADRELPESMSFDWTGVSYQEKQAGGQSLWIMALAVLLVYLVLAFLYESWLLPLAVILVVPLGLLGAVALTAWLGMVNNVYVQIGIVLIIALASKNAILIVEFARDLRAEGEEIREAALKAARLRLRPILMTSFSFILGVLPLVFASGAAAASRRAIGTAVCGGMITSTILAVFFVPVFYVTFQWLGERRASRSARRDAPPDDQKA